MLRTVTRLAVLATLAFPAVSLAQPPGQPTQALQLRAVIVDGAAPIGNDVSFTLQRVDQAQPFEVITESDGGAAEVNVPAGRYRLTTAYGATTVEQDIEIDANGQFGTHVVNLNAGEITLNMIPEIDASPIAAPVDWTIMTYGRDTNGKRHVVYEDLAADTEVTLPEGWYVVHAREGGSVTKHVIEVTAGTRYDYTLVQQ